MRVPATTAILPCLAVHVVADFNVITREHRRELLHRPCDRVRRSSWWLRFNFVSAMHARKRVLLDHDQSGSPAGTFSAVVQEVTTDTGGVGWRTQIDVAVSLALAADPGNSAVWTGGFRTGNRTAVTRPDAENVKGYAANVVAELHKSGWLVRRR